jgi:hypothetical protein
MMPLLVPPSLPLQLLPKVPLGRADSAEQAALLATGTSSQ